MSSGSKATFGVFDLDLASGELRKGGVKVRLQEQPFQVLKALVERPGEVVSREELQQLLWPDHTFVDFEDGLSTAVRKIRQALGDSATNPRFIETLPKRGYRFTAPVTRAGQHVGQSDVDADPASPAMADARRKRYAWAVAGLAIAVTLLWALAPTNEAEISWELTQVTRDAGLTFQPTLSGDGKLLAYASDRAENGNLDIWVQQVDGSSSIQLTSDPADDYFPSLSPDGTEVAFLSARNPTGVYIVSALGGEPRLLGEGVLRHIRFSPDGKWVVAMGFAKAPAKLLPVDGGAVRAVAVDDPPGFYISPLWLPDSRRLLYFTFPPAEWIVASLDGTWVHSGAAEAFQRSFLRSERGLLPGAWYTHDGRSAVIFSGQSGDETNLWSFPISSETGLVTGDPQRVTSGPGRHEQPAAAADGTIAFASLEVTVDLWSLCIDPNSGVVCGELERLTNDLASDLDPALSRDGSKLLFSSDRAGNRDVWVRDMTTGQDRQLTFTDEAEDSAVALSRDGAQAIYRERRGQVEGRNLLIPTDGGESRTLCEDCRRPRGWSTKGDVSLHALPGSTIGAVDHGDGSTWSVVDCSDYNCFFAQFSPDDHWIAFTGAPLAGGSTSVFIAPYAKGETAAEATWVRMTSISFH